MKYVPPDAFVSPTDEAIVERLARPIDRGRVHPAAARFQDMDDAADDPPVIYSRLASGICRQMQCETRELIVRQPEKVIAHSKAPFGNLES